MVDFARGRTCCQVQSRPLPSPYTPLTFSHRKQIIPPCVGAVLTAFPHNLFHPNNFPA